MDEKKIDSLSDFIKDNQSILTIIAVFTALMGFFSNIKFSEETSQTYSDIFIPFISILIVIFLLIHLYFKSLKIKSSEKELIIFRNLLLVFLFFIVMFLFEFWPNSLSLIFKIIIAIVVIQIFLFLLKKSIKYKLYKKIHWILFIWILILMSSLILLSSKCIKNSYIEFGLFSFSFSLLLWMILLLIHAYNNAFDIIISGIKEKKRKFLKKPLWLILLLVVVSVIIFYMIIILLPIELIINLLIKIIFFPKNLVCGI
jgi:hypothetical protein